MFGLDDVDDLLNGDAVGRTILVKFGVQDKKTKRKSVEWYECIVVYADTESVAIIGTDGEPYWWDQDSLEADLGEGLFKEWV